MTGCVGTGMPDGNTSACPERGSRSDAAQYCIVVACNDDRKLADHVLASDMVRRHGIEVHVERGAPSAAAAYNRGLDNTTAPIVIFAHQDVYFPPDWHARLCDVIDDLDASDPDWALVAPFGIAAEDDAYVGEVWSSSLGGMIGYSTNKPVPAQSFDELTFVMRRGSGLRFDEGLPNFHLYGTDIVQSARKAGLGAYVAMLPLVHNDSYHDQLREDFRESYNYMRRKWRDDLPIRTPVVRLTRHGVNFKIDQIRWWRSNRKRRDMSVTTEVDPKVYSARCGWEND